MINPLEDAIILTNSFEKSIIRTNMTPNKSYSTKILVSELPHLKSFDDFSQFLIEMVENSKSYTTEFISSREFSIDTTENGVYLKLTVDFYNGKGGFNFFSVPFRATIEDYIGIVEK